MAAFFYIFLILQICLQWCFTDAFKSKYQDFPQVEDEPEYGECNMLYACSVKDGVGGLPQMVSAGKGTKGDTGRPGIPGLPGRKGSPGPKGFPGYMGPEGEKGMKGEPGPPAMPLPIDDFRSACPGYGVKGVRGEKGEMGPVGFPGVPGMMGRMGVAGTDGPEGPPGTPGLPGVCGCTCASVTAPVDDKTYRKIDGSTEHESSETVTAFDVGSKFDPAISCKYIEKIKEDGNWVNPNNRFQVKCDKSTNMTCLKTKVDVDSKVINYTNKTRPFWLSEIGFDFTSIFHGYTMEQLRWLQEHSSSVTVKLQYHCLNSVAYRSNSNDLHHAVNLLSWTDVVMTPYPTSHTPLFYSVEKNFDGCKDSHNAPNVWLSTDIIIRSNIGHRLPIIDLYIKDVNLQAIDEYVEKSEKAIKLELKELCFG